MVDTVLAKKLQIKPGMKTAVINAPPNFADKLGLGDNSDLSPTPGSILDFILAFATKAEELSKLITWVKSALKPDGMLWIAYPKGGSKIKTDLNRDILRGEVLKTGLVGVSLVAIDGNWSAMLFRPAEKAGK